MLKHARRDNVRELFRCRLANDTDWVETDFGPESSFSLTASNNSRTRTRLIIFLVLGAHGLLLLLMLLLGWHGSLDVAPDDSSSPTTAAEQLAP
jgi:hypothetical protein